MTQDDDSLSNVVEVTAIFRGEVQGVGFRYVAVNEANLMGIVGTVRNDPDGSVEVIAQGSRTQLEAFLDRLQGPYGPGLVVEIAKDYRIPRHMYSRFEIVY